MTTAADLTYEMPCTDWCEGHGDEDICVIDWEGVSRLDGDGGQALARLSHDEHQLTEMAGDRIELAVLDPDDDTEAAISLSLGEARVLRDRLTELLALADAS